MYPQGATQQGVLDMAGNVWEWCLNRDENPEHPEAVHIYTGGKRVIRGGSWSYYPETLRTSSRNWYNAGARCYGIGFRLAQDIS